MSSSSSSSSSSKNPKKTKKERESEWKVDGSKRVGGVDYSSLTDKQTGDKRYERERAAFTEPQAGGQAPVSATFDAFQRMAAGLEGRSIADKINDSNRPTWEQYKKDNEDKLNLVGNEVKKMADYRAELDKERDRKLSMGSKHGKKSSAISDSESDDDSDRSEKKTKKKKDKKRHSKHSSKEKKAHKKEKKKRKRDSDADGDLSSGDDEEVGSISPKVGDNHDFGDVDIEPNAGSSI